MFVLTFFITVLYEQSRCRAERRNDSVLAAWLGSTAGRGMGYYVWKYVSWLGW